MNQGGGRPLSVQNLSPATGPLRVLPSNPRYFTDGSGKAILLVGSHTWFTMQDIGETDPPPAFDYTAFLDFVQSKGHNFFRTFVWEQSWKTWLDYDGHISPNLYKRTGPGNALDGHPRFDLTQLDQVYFDRIRERVIQAGNRGFYVSLQLFDDFSVHDKDNSGYSPYPGHPYNLANNINGIDGDPNGTGDGIQIHTLNIPAVTALQEAYVRKLIDTVNDLDNVLFEICNETENTPEAVAWQNYFIDFIHTYEAGMPKQHPVGFTVPWPNGNNADLFASNAEWVSPNDSGQDTYKTDPPTADGNKVIITDTDHLWGLGGDRVWAWKSFTRGLNPIFMDPYDDYASFIWNGYFNPEDPSVVSLRDNLGYILSYANKMNLAEMTPRSDLCSSAYCLANPVPSGAEYLIYMPSDTIAIGNLDRLASNRTVPPAESIITVDLSASTRELSVEWFNPSTGETMAEGSIVGGTSRSFTVPFSDDAVLYIYDSNSSHITPSMTNTIKPLTSTQTKIGATESVTQTSSPLPSSTPTPELPNPSLPCANGILGVSGLFLAVAGFDSLLKKGYRQ